MMSICRKAAAPVACDPPADARSQRLARFEREQLIVGYLNRGVSVAEIAARVGVGEKRMRAIIREILARRMPAPPKEFVAIQMNRLNEALLIAFSAMSPTNLKAVDQVVKIVRELDRYGGALAAEWARPEAARVEAGEGSPAFGGALFCSAELGLQDSEASSAVLAGRHRPANPAQRLEKAEFTPGFGAARDAGEDAGRAPDDPLASETAALDRCGRDRPENPAQSLENLESAPGVGMSAQTPEAASGDPVSTRDLALTLLRDAAGRQGLRACLSRLRDGGQRVAPQQDGGDFPFAAPDGRDRPENPPQDPENVESGLGVSTLVAALAERGDAVDDRVYQPRCAAARPGIQPQPSEEIDSAPGDCWLAGAAPGSGRVDTVRTAIPAPRAMTPVRMTPEDAMAC